MTSIQERLNRMKSGTGGSVQARLERMKSDGEKAASGYVSPVYQGGQETKPAQSVQPMPGASVSASQPVLHPLPAVTPSGSGGTSGTVNRSASGSLGEGRSSRDLQRSADAMAAAASELGGSKYGAGYAQKAASLSAQAQIAKRREEELPEGVRPATLYDLTVGSAKRGYVNAQYGRELYKDMTGQESRAGEYEQKLAGEAYQFAPKGLLQKAVSGAAEQIGQQFRQWTDPTAVAGATSLAGMASLAGKAGPQIAAPEEFVTVPGAALVGLQMGSAKANAEIEAGHAYKEMLDEGVSPETAKKIAVGVGLGNAALEAVQLDELVRASRVLDRIGADKTLTGAVKSELARRAGDIAKETAQEVAQEGVTIAGTQAGSKLDTGKWAYSADEVGERLGDTAISSALTFGVMNVPGMVRNVAADRQQRPAAATATAPVQTAQEPAREAVEAQTAPRVETVPQVPERVTAAAEAAREAVPAQPAQAGGQTPTQAAPVLKPVEQTFQPLPDPSRAVQEQPKQQEWTQPFDQETMLSEEEVYNVFTIIKEAEEAAERAGAGVGTDLSNKFGAALEGVDVTRLTKSEALKLADAVDDFVWQSGARGDYAERIRLIADEENVFYDRASLEAQEPGEKVSPLEMPTFEPTTGERKTGPELPISSREFGDVSSRRVKSYQYAHPELHEYYAGAAKDLWNDLTIGSRGERYPVFDQDGSQVGYTGSKRAQAEPIVRLLDEAKLSYDQIGQALGDIIEDHGKENYAAAKKVEIVLDDVLTNGYRSVDGRYIPPSGQYIDAKEEAAGGLEPGSLYRRTPEEWQSLMEAVPQEDQERKADPYSSVGAAQAGFVGDTERGFSRNLATDTARHQDIQEEYQVNPQMYHQLANATTLQRATAIMQGGLESAQSTLEQAIGAAQAGRKLAPEMVPLSKMVADALAEKGDMITAERLLSSVAVELTEAGQLGQAAKILRDASPSAKRQTIQKVVEKMNERYQKGKGKKQSGGEQKDTIIVPPELLDQFSQAADDAGRDQALDAICQSIADQTPSSLMDKFTALRYLNMLGNLKTQVRNVGGNAVMGGARFTKDRLASLIELAVFQATGGKYQRTKAFVYNPNLFKAALDDFELVKGQALGEQKYRDSTDRIPDEVDRRRTIFKNNGTWGTMPDSNPLAKGFRAATDQMFKPLEVYRRKTNDVMEWGDEIFSRFNYADSLGQYLAAHKVTAEQLTSGGLSPEFLNDARAYAIQQAQKATFRDTNQISELITSIGFKHANTNAKRIANTALQGVLPFRKTPANVMVRMFEYSPLGFVDTAVKTLQKARGSKDVTGADIVDSLATSLTGTGLFLMGMLLYNTGRLTAGEDEKSEQTELDSLTGAQNYAFRAEDGTTYTIDWMSPVSAPLLMGAEFGKLGEESRLSPWALLEAAKSITNPLLETSMLSGLNDVLDNTAYSDDKLSDIFLDSLLNYMTQGVTSTLGGQIARTMRDERTTTFADRTVETPPDVQRGLGKIEAKLPGVEGRQIPYIDAWGRTESSGPLSERVLNNFLSPWYTSEERTTEADKELQRLLDAGQTGVVPNRPKQSVEVTFKDDPTDKAEEAKKKYLTADEYVTYSTIKGETSYDMVSAMLEEEMYKAMTDEEKADAIKKAYQYAGHLAAEEVTGGKHVSDEYVSLAKAAKKELGLSEAEYLLLYETYGGSLTNGDKVRDAYARGMDPVTYLDYAITRSEYDADDNGSYSTAEIAKSIDGSGLTDEEKTILWLVTKPEWAAKAEAKGVSVTDYIAYKKTTAGIETAAEKKKALREAGLSTGLYRKIDG